LALKCGHIEGLLAKDDDKPIPEDRVSLRPEADGIVKIGSATRKVFVVHGHDVEAKETVARFLEKLELEPIILHEQPSQGRTVIEKFETSSSDVAFAVVLLTPDDLGCAANVSPEYRARARQNKFVPVGLGPLALDSAAVSVLAEPARDYHPPMTLSGCGPC
jgi:predicted nucleotide-binding protein